MKKNISIFPQGSISLVMLGQTMYYAKSSQGLGKRLAQRFSRIFKSQSKNTLYNRMHI
jgi:di/tricarboxylate transporter